MSASHWVRSVPDAAESGHRISPCLFCQAVAYFCYLEEVSARTWIGVGLRLFVVLKVLDLDLVVIHHDEKSTLKTDGQTIVFWLSFALSPQCKPEIRTSRAHSWTPVDVPRLLA